MMLVEPETKQQLKNRSGGSDCSSPVVSPKRIKLESGNESIISSSSEGKNLPPQKKLINTATHNFAIIKDMPGFVDHTYFIDRFLSNVQPRMAIFAPRRFGKSSLLHMLKTFLSCVNESTGEPYTNMNCPPEERENYELFKNTDIIRDGFYFDFLEKHPVIHLDLKEAPPIRNLEDAKNHFRKAVSWTYREHLYLQTSQKLCTDDTEANATCQRICKSWCDESQYKSQDLEDSLKNLARCLYNHFDGTQVYVLVDEFDAINESALRNIQGEYVEQVTQITDIAKFLTSTLCCVTKEFDGHVAGALFTGVSNIVGIGTVRAMNNFDKFTFLAGDYVLPSDTDLIPYYGAAEEEVRSLVKKLIQDDQLVNLKRNSKFLNGQHNLDVDKVMLDLESRYNGYIDKNGLHIFCLWSVLQYLETGESKHFWNESHSISDKLYNIFQSAAVAKNILTLMLGKTITFERRDKMYIGDLLKLHEFINEKRKEVDSTVALNFLMDRGYVSNTLAIRILREFKLPNPAIRDVFAQMLFDFFSKWDLDIMSCAEVINKLPEHKDENSLQKQMLAFHEKLNNILKILRSKNPDYEDETMVMCALYSIMDKACSFEFAVDSHLQVNGKLLSFDIPDYFLLHKSSNLCILWELKFNNDENDEKLENQTSKYALQEARGKEPTIEQKFTDYMKTVEALELDAVVIGLSVDENLNVSLSYALNNEPKIFCIAEEEKELHPDYYSDCIMLPKKENDSDNDTDTTRVDSLNGAPEHIFHT